MTATTVEERLESLELRVESLQKQLDARVSAEPTREKRGWRAIVGTFSDDPQYDDAMQLGREWRDSQRDAPLADAA